MSRITQIIYSRGASVNRGNFNNERIDTSVTVVVDEGEDPEAVYSRARDWVLKKVQADMRGEKTND